MQLNKYNTIGILFIVQPVTIHVKQKYARSIAKERSLPENFQKQNMKKNKVKLYENTFLKSRTDVYNLTV